MKKILYLIFLASFSAGVHAQSLIDLGAFNGGGCGADCFSGAFGVSATGSVIVGISDISYGGSINSNAFKYTAAEGMVYFPTNSPSNSKAYGVSGDGGVIVGLSMYPSTAFKYSVSTGSVLLGTLPNGLSSIANGVSADGSTVVGQSTANVQYGYNAIQDFQYIKSIDSFAYKHTDSTGMQSLGTVGSGTWSNATGVSSDGSVIVCMVGAGPGNNNSYVFKWTAGTGMVNLWTLAGGNSAAAYGVSSDGSVIVGASNATGSGTNSYVKWTLSSRQKV